MTLNGLYAQKMRLLEPTMKNFMRIFAGVLYKGGIERQWRRASTQVLLWHASRHS